MMCPCSHPFDFEARRAHLGAAEEQLDREAYQKLAEAAADLTRRGLAAVGFHPVCVEVVRMVCRLVDSALEFDEEAKEYELKRLQVQGSCDNPFSEAREAESFEFIARKIDGTAAEIRSMSIGKCLWNAFDERHWDDLRRIEKESVRRRLTLEYQKRRAAFELEMQAASDETESKPVCNLLEVAIATGQDSLVLRASGLPPFPIPTDRSELFRLFAAKVACGSSHECVGLSQLNYSMTREDSPSNSERASDSLRTAISRLNDELSRWALPGDEGQWIRVRKGQGYHLADTVEWRIADPGLEKELRRYSQSVWGINVAPTTLEENTPLRGQRLPAKSRHTGPHDEDEDD